MNSVQAQVAASQDALGLDMSVATSVWLAHMHWIVGIPGGVKVGQTCVFTFELAVFLSSLIA